MFVAAMKTAVIHCCNRCEAKLTTAGVLHNGATFLRPANMSDYSQ